jgi:ribosomal protein S16
MSVKIRLRRMGAKKAPFYRIVVADSRYPRDGRSLEQIGYYNPLTNPAEIKVDVERANYWISVGAQPSDTVRALLKAAGEGGYQAPGAKTLAGDRTKARPAKSAKIADDAEATEDTVADAPVAEEPATEEAAE